MNPIKALVLGAAVSLAAINSYADAQAPVIKVYKSATCGCCKGWVKHMEENGFKVITKNVDNLMDYMKKADLPAGLEACHTGFIDGYAVEGHVPAEDIKRMLKEKPAFRGIAVAGMPAGSPGMDFGNRTSSYQTISYTKDGQRSVYASH